MAAPQLKLTYFDFPGRAELIRLICAYGGVAFEDARIQRSEMPALKPSLPLGQLPVLEVNGTTYSQSMAIARYAAKLAGLYPDDAEQALRAEMVSETMIDLLMAYYLGIVFCDKGDDVKAANKKKLVDETAPRTFAALEKLVLGKFVVGDRASIADVHFFDFYERYFLELAPEFSLAAYPKLAGVVANVKANANVAAHLAKQQQQQ